jgi:hypothetical protein
MLVLFRRAPRSAEYLMIPVQNILFLSVKCYIHILSSHGVDVSNVVIWVVTLCIFPSTETLYGVSATIQKTAGDVFVL